MSVEHAARRGFRTWIYDEDKWPSGAAGGRTIAANPARFRATGLQPRFQTVQGPASVPVKFPDALYVIAARQAAPGRIASDSLTDLTDLNRSGGAWQAPAGLWVVSVFEPVRRREELPNYLNPDAVAEFIRNTYEQYAARFRSHFGKTIPGSFFDEIFNLKLAWDPLLEERFRARKGYELRKVLPLLFLDAGPETIKIRCDYFDELTRLYEESWFRQLSSWCERHNLKLTGHTNEGLYNIQDQGDYFRTWRHPQIPGTDNEDFRYTFPRVIGSWKPKQLSSVAHVYGKPRAMAESLGGAGWAITLEEARYGVNMLAVYGINYFIFHLFHYAMDSPLSMDDWPNSWFHENPYWKYFRKLADYIRRISFLASQGQHVADIAVLYPVEEVWSQGMKNPPPGEPPVVHLVDRLVRQPLDCDLVDT
ncbi:MAG: glycosyl hydrolase, partial [Bryobacteraceae bacterium]